MRPTALTSDQPKVGEDPLSCQGEHKAPKMGALGALAGCHRQARLGDATHDMGRFCVCLTSPCFAQWRERLIAAEQGPGWLDECDDAGRFLAVSQELVDTLARALRRFAGSGPVLEVCAGSGELARSLVALGVRLQATDAEPSQGAAVLRLSARAALHRFRPAVVLGVFVPHDAGVDEAVLACPTVRHYVVVNARLGGTLGSPALWATPGWRFEPLDDVRRCVLTRHDVWLGPAHPQNGDILRHGEAWHFTRVPSWFRNDEVIQRGFNQD
jgi:hypothetical protein